MKYILNDKSGLPDRVVGRAEAAKIVKDQADPVAAWRKLREGEWLTDQFGFSIRRQTTPEMTNHPNRSSKAKIARAYIAGRAGVERVRITKDGEVNAYGVMPNTNQTGWYLAGYVNDLAAEANAKSPHWHIGQRVEGGDTPEDHDTGIIREIDGEQITVAWDSSQQTTTQHCDILRAA